jgi:hypothetical protein
VSGLPRLENEVLVLRQMAGLRRNGRSQAEALTAIGDGLPDGELTEALLAARVDLESGTLSSRDPLHRLLAGDASAEALEHGARAVEAQLAANAATRLLRLYVAVALSGGALMIVLPRLVTGGPESPAVLPSSPWASVAATLVIFGLGVGVLFLIGVLVGSDRFAPGARSFRDAASLLQAAATGDSVENALPGGLWFTLFDYRRESVGATAAAAEVADELVRDGATAVLRFRHLAPVITALALIAVLSLISVLLAVLSEQELGFFGSFL